MVESVRIQGSVVVQRVIDPTEALRLLVNTRMRPFTKDDWFGFAGCETKDPMIGSSGEFVIVLDGATVSFYHCEDDYGGTIFKLEKC